MASVRLPDCILKQNTFLYYYHFWADFCSFFRIVRSRPLSSMVCGKKRQSFSAVIKSVKNILKKRVS
jgi:hypothetical protein